MEYLESWYTGDNRAAKALQQCHVGGCTEPTYAETLGFPSASARKNQGRPPMRLRRSTVPIAPEVAQVRPRVGSASTLLAAAVMLRWPRPGPGEHKTLAQRWPEKPWFRRAAGVAVAILAVTGPTTLAGAAAPPRPLRLDTVALDPRGLRAGAGFGTAVAAAEGQLVIGVPMLGGGVAYVYRRDAGAWRQTAELRGSDTQPGDFFGGAVAISGGTIVVGADNHDHTGRVYVFTQDRGGWDQTAELAGLASGPGSAFGYSVAVGAGTIVVGAPMPVLGTGMAYVFAQDRGNWRQVAELLAQNAPVGGYFGFSVAASGRTAVVGDPGDMVGAGRAYVFNAAVDGWHETAELAGRDTQAGDNFGFSLAQSAGQILVGAPWHGAGAAYVFNDVHGWDQTAKLTGDGTRPGDKFGCSVALGLALAVVGAPWHDAGAAYVFSAGGHGWRQTAELTGPTGPRSYFGTASAVSGAAVTIGANGYRGGTGVAWATTLVSGYAAYRQPSSTGPV
jgi:hypothetical protein